MKSLTLLNPETITVLDPACGSGHILVEAYDVLKAIYLERGYRMRDIPRLILENNLFGLDIDDRAAQLAGFALLMKARADDRRLLDNPPKLNVLALQESKRLDADELTQALSGYATLTRSIIASLIDTFAHAKTFGSLIECTTADNRGGFTKGYSKRRSFYARGRIKSVATGAAGAGFGDAVRYGSGESAVHGWQRDGSIFEAICQPILYTLPPRPICNVCRESDRLC